MKAVFSSDLHGEISLYEELLILVKSSQADIVVLGGDLLPSFSPTRRYEDIIPYQKNFINRFLASFFEKMTRTASVAGVFLIPGNWDIGYPYLFDEPIAGCVDLSRKRHCLENGYEIIGYPFVPPTPFRPKDFEKMDDRESPWPPQKVPSYIRSPDQPDRLLSIDPSLYLRQRETIEEDLDRLPRPNDYRKTLYVMHSPPFETALDRIEGGGYVGSRSIRRFIEKNQPLATLHGHIHEAPVISGSYADRIGKTISVNPGQFIHGKMRLHAVTFEVENPEKTLQHTLIR